ncbi:MAG: hypothetical protein AAFX78_11900 [Cyanobacteria bacterium J06638_20]
MTSCTSYQPSGVTEQPTHSTNHSDPKNGYLIAQASSPKSLLAEISGQAIDETELDSSLIFLAASLTLLLGVMAINRSPDPHNQSYLQSVLDAALQNGKLSPHLVQALTEGIDSHQLYLNPRLFLLMTSTLSESERLLLLGLGYDMATAGTHFGLQTQMYLQAIAQRLRIPPAYQACLESSFTQQDIAHLDALPDIADLTHPTSFQPESNLLQLLAHRIHPSMERLATLANA